MHNGEIVVGESKCTVRDVIFNSQRVLVVVNDVVLVNCDVLVAVVALVCMFDTKCVVKLMNSDSYYLNLLFAKIFATYDIQPQP